MNHHRCTLVANRTLAANVRRHTSAEHVAEYRFAWLLVNVDADGTAVRGQDAGEETSISRAQDVLRCDGTAGVEKGADQRTAKSGPGVGRIEDRPGWNATGRRGAHCEIFVARQCA